MGGVSTIIISFTAACSGDSSSEGEPDVSEDEDFLSATADAVNRSTDAANSTLDPFGQRSPRASVRSASPTASPRPAPARGNLRPVPATAPTILASTGLGGASQEELIAMFATVHKDLGDSLVAAFHGEKKRKLSEEDIGELAEEPVLVDVLDHHLLDDAVTVGDWTARN